LYLIQNCPDIFTMEFCLLFSVDHTTGVCFFNPSTLRQSSREGAHGSNPDRIAIWDWNKGILAIVTTIWMTNVSFLIYCKSISTRPVGSTPKYGLLSGSIRVKNLLYHKYLDFMGSSLLRSVPCGTQCLSSAVYPTLRAEYQPLFPCLSHILSW
jgi:hypothetical protein